MVPQGREQSAAQGPQGRLHRCKVRFHLLFCGGHSGANPISAAQSPGNAQPVHTSGGQMARAAGAAPPMQVCEEEKSPLRPPRRRPEAPEP